MNYPTLFLVFTLGVVCGLLFSAGQEIKGYHTISALYDEVLSYRQYRYYECKKILPYIPVEGGTVQLLRPQSLVKQAQ